MVNFFYFPTFIDLFDIYGLSFPWYFKKKQVYKSLFGAILSLLSICSFCFLTIYLCLELWSKNNVTVLTSIHGSGHPKIDLSNIPILFKLTNINGVHIEPDPNLYNFAVRLVKYESVVSDLGIQSTVVSSQEVNYEICNWSKHFHSYGEYFKTFNLTSYYCITPGNNLTIHGRYGDVIGGFQAILWNVNKCDRTNSSNNCYSEQVINSNLSSSVISVYFITHFVDHYNRTQANHYGIRNEVMSFSPWMIKKYYYKISQSFYDTDKGLVFEEFQRNEFYEYQTYFIDIDNWGDSETVRTMGFFAFVCDEFIVTYKRTYTKIQIVIASIGGCINFIYTICRLIVRFFMQKHLEIELINTLLTCNSQKDKNNKRAFNYGNSNRNINKIKSDKIKKGIILNDATRANMNNTSKNISILVNSNSNNSNSNNLHQLNINRFNCYDHSNSSVNDLILLNKKPIESPVQKGRKFVRCKTSESSTNSNNVWNPFPFLRQIRQSKGLTQEVKYSWYNYLFPSAWICNPELKRIMIWCNELIHTSLSIDYIVPSIEKGNFIYNVLNYNEEWKEEYQLIYQGKTKLNYQNYWRVSEFVT